MDRQNIYIGLGSNLNEPRLQITNAINEIKLLENCDFILNSSLYKSPPMGPQDQPDYFNSVLKMSSNLTAIKLLDKLQNIEQQHGRIQKERWGARSLDLDILLYGQQVINSDRLTIPHLGLYIRAFVLYPLYEIEPKLILPNGVALSEQVKALGKQDIEKII
ncbi:2-amino-4-hydroxy-6-hydroxymethyldihydropteridinepyrophosphokinase [hydrothermal vent metagenome]|uniref:2-amino-4-hydroxy-6-hydroxymethyldihydropteridine diphosphokinase n=1 Tax=hydrothermal vent metagenome TaxID=652676 RepID=A0A3B0ZH19_9ZZZZ